MRVRRPLRCSFCGKNENDVAKLVAGPRVYICDACVAVAQRLMEDDAGVSLPPARTTRSLWRRLSDLAGRLVMRRGFASAHGR